jgi:photosystem II stability/assembly factor-like uncharacterized protein
MMIIIKPLQLLFKYQLTFLLSLILLFTFEGNTLAQKRKRQSDTMPGPTSAIDRWNGYQQRIKLQKESIFKNIPFRNVGPTIMSGRVVDIEVDPSDPSHFYVAYASGGLWETKNEGASFTSLFDNEIVMTIGDIAVNWDLEIIYVGTGENNSSRSSYSGYGLFKSTDNGKTWQHLGLPDSHHIGRVILHPNDPDIIWIASLGHLYSRNQERGVFKSSDGGNTWTKTLYIDDQSGIVELVINPENPDHLIAASWQKDRKAWDFVESGDGTGLYKSIDGGESWINISEGDSGFPDTKGTGRIGLTYVNTHTLFAVLDNQDRRPQSNDEVVYPVDKELLKIITSGSFDSLANSDVNDFLDRNRFPRDINAVDLKKRIKNGTLSPVDLVNFLEDANAQLFDTQVIGGEVYRSDDGGASWSKTHEGSIEDFIYSYGYYFGQIRHDPSNPDQLYILGVPILSSEDGGKHWSSINGDNVHADHHALWVNPQRPGHLILGNDGGINISKDNGVTWLKCNSIPLGQFYSVNVDMAEPYNVYGGLQDNGVWKGPSTYEYSNEWLSEGKYPYEALMGGDGMKVQIDPRDNTTVYTGFQFGNYYRIDTETGKRQRITPLHELGERPYRWNWQSPILLSEHNPDIVYFGSNHFHRSMKKGEDFEDLSEDLTLGGKKGDVAYGTITTISESPLKFGLIYIGTDDGLIQVSNDVGDTWKKITDGLPTNYWVSRVEASHHREGRVYAALNGYRWDNFKALIYVSDDYGSTWKPIGLDLPAEPVNVIKEDPKNPNLLYVGTDHGLYASMDAGDHFMILGNLPAVAIHDVVVHPRDNDLVVGTHGRSIYIGNVEHLQMMSNQMLTEGNSIFQLSNPAYNDRWGNKWWTWGEYYEPELMIPFLAASAGEAKLEIKSSDQLIKSWIEKTDKGLNYLAYDLTIDNKQKENYQSSLSDQLKDSFKAAENGNWYLRPGKYTIVITNQGQTTKADFEIKAPKERPKRKS